MCWGKGGNWIRIGAGGWQTDWKLIIVIPCIWYNRLDSFSVSSVTQECLVTVWQPCQVAEAHIQSTKLESDCIGCNSQDSLAIFGLVAPCIYQCFLYFFLLQDPNQLIRASALRVLSSIRVSVIAPIMMLAIKDAVMDMSPYVRKTAAHAIPKLYGYVFSFVFYIFE